MVEIVADVVVRSASWWSREKGTSASVVGAGEVVLEGGENRGSRSMKNVDVSSRWWSWSASWLLGGKEGGRVGRVARCPMSPQTHGTYDRRVTRDAKNVALAFSFIRSFYPVMHR